MVVSALDEDSCSEGSFRVQMVQGFFGLGIRVQELRLTACRVLIAKRRCGYGDLQGRGGVKLLPMVVLWFLTVI